MNSEESTNPQWNLGGKLVIKAQLEDDIRRIPIHNEDITYDELVLMMQRVFRGKLSTSDEVLLKYKDEDGDLVTIFDSSDLTSAIQCSRTLKLTVFLNSQSGESPLDEKPNKGITNILAIRKELSGIRDRVIHLLDQLDITPQESVSRDSPVTNHVEAEKQIVQTVKATTGHAKEFDPYPQKNEMGKETDKVSEAFGVEPTSQAESMIATSRQQTPALQPIVGAAAAQPIAPQPPNAAGMQQMGQQQLPQQQQGMPTHPMQATQPSMGSPYHSPAYQQQAQPLGQQRFQPQTSTAYSLSAQQPTTYPQAGYSPQSIQQQAYAQPTPYNPQGSTQQQQQNQPHVPGQPGAPPVPYGGGASQQTQTYNPAVPSQGQQLSQGQGGFNYSGYPPTATTPTNPYSRGGQPAPPYASRPQPPQYH